MTEDLNIKEKMIVAAIGSLVDDLLGGFNSDTTSVESMEKIISEAICAFESATPQEQHDAEEVAQGVIARLESVVSLKH